MAVRTAKATWSGDLASGTGEVSTESGILDAGYSFSSRFEEGAGTNPEELIGAALAGCFAMALSHELAEAGHDPESVYAEAQVHLAMTDDGPSLGQIDLVCEAKVGDIDDTTFQNFANGAKEGCPISQALSAVTITLEAKLVD